jgi:retron-type reverse transcriptase
MLLEPLYEPLFHAGSYGFRPGRSAHQALESLWKQLMDSTGGWILDVDIRKFFDTLDHRHLQALLRHRVRDGVLLRLIGKWLNAGVLEDGEITHPDEGSRMWLNREGRARRRQERSGRCRVFGTARMWKGA